MSQPFPDAAQQPAAAQPAGGPAREGAPAAAAPGAASGAASGAVAAPAPGAPGPGAGVILRAVPAGPSRPAAAPAPATPAPAVPPAAVAPAPGPAAPRPQGPVPVPAPVAAPSVAAAPVAARPAHAVAVPATPVQAAPAPSVPAVRPPAPAAPAAVPPAAPAPGARPFAPAAPARLRGRHWILAVSFLLVVALPVAAAAWYLWTRAADQYASTVGFSVRREEMGSALDLLGGISAISGSSSSDTDILYEFLQGQELVADMDRALDLRAIWSRPEADPWYAFDPSGTIEDLVAYWGQMVRISYDSSSGLIEVRVLAFNPDDATRVAAALFDESSEMINSLSAIAQEDSVGYARQELEDAVERLKGAREAVTEFRNLNQLVDPGLDLAAQAGVLGTLQAQLAEALIEVDMLGGETGASDPRMTQATRRVEVIEARIDAERDKLGLGSEGATGEAFAGLVGDYERLAVDREFAEQSYVAALATYDSAVSEARRKSRYLAAHILPTRAESSRFPNRGATLMLGALFLTLAWAIAVLVAYSVKDRR